MQLLLLCGFLTLPGNRGTWRQRRFLLCICTVLLSWITHANLVPLSVTKRRRVHFILNPGHVEYELGVLMVWKLSRPKQNSNLRPVWKSSAIFTRPPSPPVRFQKWTYFIQYYIVLVQWALFIPTIHDRNFSDVKLRERWNTEPGLWLIVRLLNID